MLLNLRGGLPVEAWMGWRNQTLSSIRLCEILSIVGRYEILSIVGRYEMLSVARRYGMLSIDKVARCRRLAICGILGDLQSAALLNLCSQIELRHHFGGRHRLVGRRARRCSWNIPHARQARKHNRLLASPLARHITLLVRHVVHHVDPSLFDKGKSFCRC